MGKKSYSEKLKDPRWQKRRLAVLERDGWTCQNCGDTDSTLHVHHRWYEGEPWDAPDEALETLCADCHQEEWECRPREEAFLIAVLKRHLRQEGVSALAHTLNEAFCSQACPPRTLIDAIYWLAENEKNLADLADRYEAAMIERHGRRS